ncbi:MAG: hypothetical protein ACM3QS_08520, partial [Bacteroidota bacterium]
MKKPSLAGLHECWELSAREVLLPLLRPSEPLRIALSGATGWLQGVSFLDLLPLLLGVLGPRTTYIGIT